MAFDNRHTVASRRTVLPPAGRGSRTFTNGITLGVVIGAVSATLTYAALFAGPNRSTAVIASAATVTPKPPAVAVPVNSPAEQIAPAPAPTSAADVAKSDSSGVVAAISAPILAKSDPAEASPELKPQAQRDESRPRHRRERQTVRRERPRDTQGWYGDARANPWGQPYYRGRSQWSW